MPATISEERRRDVHSLPEAGCDIVRDALVSDGARRVVEIGLGYGCSAAAIEEAIGRYPDGLHIVIDPHQAQFQDEGLEVLDDRAHFYRLPSQWVLPRLVEQGMQVDAAFVDGSHKFHDVFLDLYYLMQIVKPGGLVIVDDLVGWPSVSMAVQYFATNFHWIREPGPPRIGFLRLPDPAPDLSSWEI